MVEEKINELRKEFVMIKTFEMKPNFKYLGEKYGLDPRTVKKYYEGYEGKPTTRNKPSMLDDLKGTIKEKLSLNGIKISSLYFYLVNEKDYKGSYSNLTYYIRNDEELKIKHSETVNVRYETEPGEDIIGIIKKINIEVNNRTNSTTNMKPILLYMKEKEYLQPLPSNDVLEYYMNLSKAVKVQNTSLINYKGCEYSVPSKFINKTLKVKERDNKLYIYNNTELVVIHDISDKKINYKEDHYVEGLKKSMPNKTEEDIEKLAKKNLKLFDEILNNGKKD